MAFLKTIKTETGLIGIWELNDSLEELVTNFRFAEKEKAEYAAITYEKRKKEYLACRLLLSKIRGTKTTINYLPSGKPVLNENNLNISISHSKDLVVVFISNNNIGIDVENTTRNIEKVANRFLNKKEKIQIEKTQSIQKASIIYWCAKEAIFKCTNQQNILFSKQIILSPFEIKEEGTFSGILKTDSKNSEYNLLYFFCKNNAIVYCVEN